MATGVQRSASSLSARTTDPRQTAQAYEAGCANLRSTDDVRGRILEPALWVAHLLADHRTPLPVHPFAGHRFWKGLRPDLAGKAVLASAI